MVSYEIHRQNLSNIKLLQFISLPKAADRILTEVSDSTTDRLISLALFVVQIIQGSR